MLQLLQQHLITEDSEEEEEEVEDYKSTTWREERSVSWATSGLGGPGVPTKRQTS